MSNQKLFSGRKTLFLTLILLPITLLGSASVGITGLAGINPDNQNKTLLYPISNAQVHLVQNAFIFLMVPVSIGLVFLALLNIKLLNRRLNYTILIASAALVCWLLFTSWALNGRYVSIPNPTNRSQPTNSAPGESNLHIRSFNIQ